MGSLQLRISESGRLRLRLIVFCPFDCTSLDSEFPFKLVVEGEYTGLLLHQALTPNGYFRLLP